MIKSVFIMTAAALIVLLLAAACKDTGTQPSAISTHEGGPELGTQTPAALDSKQARLSTPDMTPIREAATFAATPRPSRPPATSQPTPTPPVTPTPLPQPGEFLWDVQRNDERNDYAPVIADGVVFAVFDGNLLALDAENGERLWEKRAVRIARGGDATRYGYTIPTVSKGVAYVGGYSAAAIDVKTGELLWETEGHRYGYSTPIINDGAIYSFITRSEMVVLDASTGDLLRTFETPLVNSVTSALGTIYIMDFYSSVRKSTSEQLHAIDTDNGELLWSYRNGNRNPYNDSPAVSDGLAYVGIIDNADSDSPEHYLDALDALTGELVWRFETDGEIESSPVTHNGLVFVGTRKGHLYAMDAKTGRLIWEFRLGGRPRVYTVVDGILYILSNGDIIAMNAETGGPFWWIPGRYEDFAVSDGVVYAGMGQNAIRALRAPRPIDDSLGSADLALEASVSREYDDSSQSLVYVLTVDNHGPSGAFGSVVKFQMPDFSELSSTTDFPTDACLPVSPSAGEMVYCSLGNLALGSHTKVKIELKVQGASSGRLALEVESLNSDPVEANNAARLETEVVRERFQAISSGPLHTCGLKTDGSVACWGSNKLGQLDPPESQSFGSISTGNAHTCALEIDGTAVCWGAGTDDELLAPANERFESISSGKHHFVCGLKSDKTLVCWGRYPEVVMSPPAGQFTSVSSGETHACALDKNGTAVCWGRYSWSIFPFHIPQPMRETFVSISSGFDHTCGLRKDGAAVCWGDNGAPAWDSDGRASPPEGERFSAISGGQYHTCGLREDGTAMCWGRDSHQLEPPLPGDKFTSISSGASHTCATRDDGAAVCWGDNGSGQSWAP